ncbi:PTS sugar transporter subunit IIA [Vallitalea pronyensis]|uniref:Ascorbate-specific PTS system EIIA component n=1 Tax=Vallitalea pronyensis TaxID=1348613 RepID=A0A8J8MJP6_9FIRM|nr:PTS sugar transporter subunit IIA [Vallitalea pronyensis]QUI22533.1 PTS sugar transporter subunit IIA [Vallitalea pronyensis]
MLKDLCKVHDLIRVQVEVDDWEKAVNQGIQLLEAADFVEDGYGHAIIEDTKEHGPYYVICPGVAMPHARPEAGVKANGISIMTLKNPVNFGNPDNDPVHIVISLAATDNVTHLEMMQDVVTMLSSEENINKIKEADTADKILALL